MGCNSKLIINRLKGELLKLRAELLRARLENRKLKKELAKYKEMAYKDTLTSLNNRRSLESISDYDCLILGDIDHFKIINDTYGHLVGDEVLVEISSVFKHFVRETDYVCRWGGEEFLIFLKNCDDEDAYGKANLLREKIMELSDEFGFEITMSFGVSNLSDSTLEDAIKNADEAMYESKHNGRNRVTVYQLEKKK